jgi:hypothetical protein
MTAAYTTSQLAELAHAGIRPATGSELVAATSFPGTTLMLGANGLRYVDAPMAPIGDDQLSALADAMRDEQRYGALAVMMRV